MTKQSRSKRPENPFAKGKVTPIQVAFIVDRYLCDNNFSETRSVFRTEASSLISKSPVQEAPKSLLSLASMLNEYICLKEQKVMVDQERLRLDQEKSRVQNLLNGMQDVMNAYNATTSTPMIQAPVANPAKSTAVIPQSVPSSRSPSGYFVHNIPSVVSMSMPSNVVKEHEYFSPPVPNCPSTRKRAGLKVFETAPQTSKRSRSKIAPKKLPDKDTQSKNAVSNQDTAESSSMVELSPHKCAPNGLLVQGSCVAKSLFNQPNPINSSGPNTPPQPVSLQADKSPLGNSAVANCSANNTPQYITPTNCTVISSERVRVSPYKQMTVYTMERNNCISTSSPVKANLKRVSKRDHVKGRLDFDGSDVAENLDKPIVNELSTSDSEKEADIFDMDFPNLDALGPNFSFSELLVDLDLDCEGIGFPCHPTLDNSMDNVSGSSHDSGDANLGADQVVSEYSSTVTKVLSGKDMNPEGPDNTLTSVKSITKCIRILSPAKGRRSSLDQQN